MSCYRVAPEFTREKFSFKYEHPSQLAIWRCSSGYGGRTFYVYRILVALTAFVLLVLDYIWIFAFNGVAPHDRLSAVLDASQWALLALCISYAFLAVSASHWVRVDWDVTSEGSIPYTGSWGLYVCSVNAVYSTMITFWVVYTGSSTTEEIVKHSLPGCLVFIDLCLSGIPMRLCHFVYPMAVYLAYLCVCSIGLVLTYLVQGHDAELNPTVWIAGSPMMPAGYADFTNATRAIAIILGAVALAVFTHSLIVSTTVVRDFLVSMCGVAVYISGDDRDDLLSTDLLSQHTVMSSSTLSIPSRGHASTDGTSFQFN